MKRLTMVLLAVGLAGVVLLTGCIGTPPPEELRAYEFSSDDGRVTFVLDQVQRTKVWPAELQDGGMPKEGHDFVVVDVTIVRIKDGHVDARFGSIIIDNNGAKYNEAGFKWTEWKFYDPHDITTGTELLKGVQGTLIFELPENVKPIKVKLAYLFFKSWSESGQHESEDERYIDIILP